MKKRISEDQSKDESTIFIIEEDLNVRPNRKCYGNDVDIITGPLRKYSQYLHKRVKERVQ